MIAEEPFATRLLNANLGHNLLNMSRTPQIDWIDIPPNIRNQYQYFTEAKMARLRAAGYDKPFTSLETGVTRYVQDFLHTADPYR